MKLATAALLLTWAAPAMAQEAKKDPLAEFDYGQRVEVFLKSGFGILGKLHPVEVFKETPEGLKKEIVPLAKTKIIQLDLSLEYPELGGAQAPENSKVLQPNVVGVERGHISDVRRLPDLTLEEVEARERARGAALIRILAEDEARKQAELQYEEERTKELEQLAQKKQEEEAKTLEGQLRQEADRIAKARAIYTKYPPEQGWGPSKVQELQGKVTRKQMWSAEEKEFMENIQDWLWYAEYLKKQKSESEK